MRNLSQREYTFLSGLLTAKKCLLGPIPFKLVACIHAYVFEDRGSISRTLRVLQAEDLIFYNQATDVVRVTNLFRLDLQHSQDSDVPVIPEGAIEVLVRQHLLDKHRSFTSQDIKTPDNIRRRKKRTKTEQT